MELRKEETKEEIKEELKEEIKEKELLTTREKEIIRLIAKGYSKERIKEELFIEKSTIKYHVKNIFKKLRVNNGIKAVILSIKKGIINIDEINEKEIELNKSNCGEYGEYEE